MALQMPTKIVLKSTTKMSLNDRFTSIQKATPMQNIRAKMAAQQQASSQNRRLAQQMANRPTVMAALKLKKKSLKQRLGTPNQQQLSGSVKSRLNLAGVTRGQGRRGRGTMRGQINTSRGGFRGNQTQRGGRGRGNQTQMMRGGRGQMRAALARGGRGQGRGRGINRGFGNQRGGRGFNKLRGGARGRVIRGRYQRGGRGSQGRGRGRGRGSQQKQLNKDDLDSQLDIYMSKTRAHLDAELDAYMAEAD